MTQPDEERSDSVLPDSVFSDSLPSEQASGTDVLVSRLRVIEDQPLEHRASAFAQVHDELQSALERADAPVRNG